MNLHFVQNNAWDFSLRAQWPLCKTLILILCTLLKDLCVSTTASAQADEFAWLQTFLGNNLYAVQHHVWFARN
jgi:hypothetical protein